MNVIKIIYCCVHRALNFLSLNYTFKIGLEVMFCLHVYFRFNQSKLQDIKTDLGHRDATEPNGDL